MTTDQLSVRSLDAEVARVLWDNDAVYEVEGDWYWWNPFSDEFEAPVPKFSSTYEGMGLVIERMVARGYECELGVRCHPSLVFHAAFWIGNGFNTRRSMEAPTLLPEAAARAALAAKGEGGQP